MDASLMSLLPHCRAAHTTLTAGNEARQSCFGRTGLLVHKAFVGRELGLPICSGSRFGRYRLGIPGAPLACHQLEVRAGTEQPAGPTPTD